MRTVIVTDGGHGSAASDLCASMADWIASWGVQNAAANPSPEVEKM